MFTFIFTPQVSFRGTLKSCSLWFILHSLYSIRSLKTHSSPSPPELPCLYLQPYSSTHPPQPSDPWSYDHSLEIHLPLSFAMLFSPRKLIPSSQSSSKETVICPHQPILTKFDWLRSYEVARVLHTIIDPDALKLEGASIIKPKWLHSHPAQLRDLVIDSLKCQPKLWIDGHLRRAGQATQMRYQLKLALQDSLDDLDRYRALQDRLEYSLELDHTHQDPNLKLRLCPARLGPPNALYRQFGSTRFLTVRLDPKKLGAHLRSNSAKFQLSRDLVNKFFNQPVRISQRVFYVFLRKDVSLVLHLSSLAMLWVFRIRLFSILNSDAWSSRWWGGGQ